MVPGTAWGYCEVHPQADTGPYCNRNYLQRRWTDDSGASYVNSQIDLDGNIWVLFFRYRNTPYNDRKQNTLFKEEMNMKKMIEIDEPYTMDTSVPENLKTLSILARGAIMEYIRSEDVCDDPKVLKLLEVAWEVADESVDLLKQHCETMNHMRETIDKMESMLQRYETRYDSVCDELRVLSNKVDALKKS